MSLAGWHERAMVAPRLLLILDQRSLLVIVIVSHICGD